MPKSQLDVKAHAPTHTQSGTYQLFLPVVIKQELQGYFVSPNGSDTNPGTLRQPWKTLSYAVHQIYAGETLYIREGTYHEHFWIGHSGTETRPIIVTNYDGEEVIIDGNNYTFPSHGSGTPLVGVTGDWVIVSNLAIRYSGDMGIYAGGDHVTLDNLYIHHNWGSGMILSGDYDIVQNSRIWSNSMINENGLSPHWGSGVAATRNTYAEIRKNVVWENWGEGIISGSADQVTIENNHSHDNFSANIYITDSTNVLCRNNFVYMDPDSYVYGYGANVGIMMGDESSTPPSANITIINNIAFGNHGNFWWWRGNQGGGMNNVLIANNTFVNGTGDPHRGEGGVIISRGDHQNVRFENNLVQQDGDLPVIATIDQPGVLYSHNLWSKPPYDAASGPGDIIGDPLLELNGDPFSPGWFRLTESSPAIDHALSIPEVLVDFFSLTRDSSPDMGAIEYFP